MTGGSKRQKSARLVGAATSPRGPSVVEATTAGRGRPAYKAEGHFGRSVAVHRLLVEGEGEGLSRASQATAASWVGVGRRW